jgi:flagellar assembly factor FliW
VISATERSRSATVAAVEELPELTFVRPLPGFGDLRRFVLVDLEPPGDHPAEGAEPVLFELRSLEDPAVRFLVAAPAAFFPDYSFELDETECEALGLRAESDALVLVLLTVGHDSGDEAAPTTANLLAPVVVNVGTRSAAQVILAGTDWPVRAAVVPAA